MDKNTWKVLAIIFFCLLIISIAYLLPSKTEISGITSKIQKIQEVEKWESWEEYREYMEDICKKDSRVIINEKNLNEIDCMCDVCKGADSYSYESTNKRCYCYVNHKKTKEINMELFSDD